MDNDKLRVEVEAPRIADVLESINEKMGRFVAVNENNHKEHEAYTEKVLLENVTQRELLGGLVKLSGQFDKWFELQTKPVVMVKAPAEQCLDELAGALTAAVDAQDARKMGEELQRVMRVGRHPEFGRDEALEEVCAVLKKYGYGP